MSIYCDGCGITTIDTAGTEWYVVKCEDPTISTRHFCDTRCIVNFYAKDVVNGTSGATTIKRKKAKKLALEQLTRKDIVPDGGVLYTPKSSRTW